MCDGEILAYSITKKPNMEMVLGMLNQMYRRIKLPEGVVYFFGLMKSELLYSGKYISADTFIKDLVEYIEYYNNERIKLRLNGMSPVQYRKMLTASIV